MDDRRITEADMHGGRALNAFERGIKTFEPDLPRLSARACMEGSSICTTSAPAANKPLISAFIAAA